jgi:hypothetical protein
VGVAAVHGEEGVGEGAAGPVEGIAVAVLADLEADVDVDLGSVR